jgi:serine/threonine-protein kinase
MSRVFVAQEHALGCDVVVKVLSPERAASLSAERFTREIKLAAALQDPHIVPVLAAGTTSEGLPYYTMPFVRGDSLRARLLAGPVPLAEALGMLRNIAQALAYAHESGIVHRDIKPENVLLSRGTAVVTDVGIAKALSASSTKAEGNTLTSVGTSIGTPAYIAPEQALGDVNTDARADLYAWGVVAYELFAGAHPFGARTTPQAMVAAHISEAPPPLDAARLSVPRDVAALVMQCLAKDPAQRPPSADALLTRLANVQTPSSESPAPQPARSNRSVLVAASLAVPLGAAALFAWGSRTRDTGSADRDRTESAEAATTIETLAVLPFVNVSGDPKDEYFADGITDELTNALSKLPGLRLAGRSSSFAFKGKHVSAKEVGQQLEVAALIEGTVRCAGGRVRITVQLTSGADGKALWQNSYENDKDDVFQVQDEVTAAIVSAVSPTLRGSTIATSAVATRGTRDTLAYDLYLQGRYLFAQRNAAALTRAIAAYRGAIARDSGFARAYAALGQVYAVFPAYADSVDERGMFAAAEQQARRALQIDSTVADAYLVLGLSNFKPGPSFATGAAYLERALRLEPNNPTAHYWLAQLPAARGDLDSALAEIRRARTLDPMSNAIANGELRMLNSRGDYAAARRAGELLLARDSLYGFARSSLAISLIFSGAPDSALATLRLVPGRLSENRGIMLFTLAAAGRWSDAERLRDSIAQRRDRRGWNADSWLSAMAFGEYDQAIDLLTAGWDTNFLSRAVFASVSCDPLLQPLRTNPRFLALLDRGGIRRCPNAATMKWPIPPSATAGKQ